MPKDKKNTKITGDAILNNMSNMTDEQKMNAFKLAEASLADDGARIKMEIKKAKEKLKKSD